MCSILPTTVCCLDDVGRRRGWPGHARRGPSCPPPRQVNCPQKIAVEARFLDENAGIASRPALKGPAYSSGYARETP